MDKKTLKKFEEMLEIEKKKLEKKLKSFAKKNPKIKGDYTTKMPDIGTGDDENANEVAMYSNALSLEHAFESRLQKIIITLEKIKKGKYGICGKCKKNIDTKRLEIYPEARYCMKCHQA